MRTCTFRRIRCSNATSVWRIFALPNLLSLGMTEAVPPTRAARASASETGTRQPAPSLDRDGAPCRGLVLVVDDEEHLADAVAQLLQRAGFRAVQVHDGRAALAAAQELQPDLVLLDYELPELDGLAVIEALRGRPETRELSVLLNSSAQVSFAEIQRADGFLSKPFTDSLLYSMIDRVLAKNTASQRKGR